MVISTKKRWIGFLSPIYPGRHHDFSVLKTCLSPEKQWFRKFKVRLDLGFLGFDKLYSCQAFFLPFKKPKGQELTDAQQAVNKKQARERVVVEHALGGLRRYRILSDRLRLHDLERYDDILGICAGLWNFNLCP